MACVKFKHSKSVLQHKRRRFLVVVSWVTYKNGYVNRASAKLMDRYA